MEEADKIKIRKIIQDTINELVYEEVGKMPEKIAQKKQEQSLSKSQKEEKVHDVLFFGGGTKQDFSTKFNIREGNQIRITASEIDQFQKDLASHLDGHSLEFQKQNIGGKESIVNFPVESNTVDAIIIVKVDENSEFSMSLKNGLIFKTNGLVVNEENKELVLKLHNLYTTIFKKKFSEIISSPASDVNAQPEQQSEQPQPDQPTQ